MKSLVAIMFALGFALASQGAPLPLSEGLATVDSNAPNASAAIVPGAPDGSAEVKLGFGPCSPDAKYAGAALRFKTPLDMEGFKSLSFNASSSARLHVKIGLLCAGGRFDMKLPGGSDFLAEPLSKTPSKCEFRRELFKASGTPDLSKVEAIELGFGLWSSDAGSARVEVVLKDFQLSGGPDPFIIPPPTTGVSIDGQWRDWGFENVLYQWTPPQFVKLERADQAISARGSWRGPEALSGKFSFMMDDKKLYVLAVVADSTPFGGSSASPWENDSVELFLSFDSDEAEISKAPSLKAKGVQIVYDCHASGEATLIDAKGMSRPSSIETKLVPETILVDGKQCKGYVLESAIPLSLLPVKEKVKGMPVAFSIKLNDADSKATLCATPANQEPFSTIASFKRAFVEIETERRREPFKFGPLASDILWPSQYSSERGQRVWDMDKAWKDESANGVVKRICLNSLWAVQAADGDSSSPDPGKWIYVPCPMGIGWAMPAFKPSVDGAPVREENAFGPLGGSKKEFFWYERSFSLPPGPVPSEVDLVFEHLKKEAEVYVNGTFAGKASLLRDRLPIGRLLKEGAVDRLDLLLYAPSNPAYSFSNGKCGVAGDVWLELRNSPPLLTDVKIEMADGLDGSLKIRVDSAKGPQRLVKAELRDVKSGKTLLSLEKSSVGGSDLLSGVFKDFAPWSPERPQLYLLAVSLLENGKIVDEKSLKFGFKTFTWDGPHFLLNGKVLRVRAVSPAGGGAQCLVPGEFAKFKQYGYNGIYLHSDGDLGWNDPLFDRLDEEGFVAFVPMDKTWPDELTAKMAALYRRHPSILGYVSDAYGQVSVNGWGYNPFALAKDDYYPESLEAKKIQARLSDRLAFFKTLDPTRPYISQATGNLEGSFKNTHHYPTFDLTLIDRLMYYAPWAARKPASCPHYVYEAGVHALHDVDASNPDFKFLVSSDSYSDKEAQRLMTREAASRYIGTKAFDNWRLWDVMEAKANLRGYRISGVDGFIPWFAGFKFLDVVNSRKPEDIPDKRKRSCEDILKPFRLTIDDALMRQNQWHYSLRAQACWRWPERYGFGELEEKPGVFTPLFLNEMQPFFACVGGRPENVFSMERNYFAGETIDKTVVARNDSENAVSVDFKATLSVAGKTLSKTLKLNVAQGGLVKAPLSFSAPETKERSRGEIRLEWTMPDGAKRQDVLELTVFPRIEGAPSVPASLKIADVPSPDGFSLLSKMGVRCERLDAEAALKSGAGLVVFERNALVKSVDPALLRAYLAEGGKLLAMEQSDAGLFDWRLRERRLETLFPSFPDHPALKGLDASDLAFLRGPDDMIPSERRPSDCFRHGLSAALSTPRLSNEGISAAFVMAKPCYGSFSPLIVGGFDLEEVALLEFRSGKGLAMLCQVDASGRYGKDPVATILARNIVEFMANEKTAPLKTAFYLGGPKGAALLDRLGVARSSVRSEAGDVLILGDGGDLAKLELDSFKTVLVLPCAEKLPGGTTAKPVRLKAPDYPCYWRPNSYSQFDMMKSILPAADRLKGEIPSEFAGLVDNDLYFFDSPELKAYSSPNSVWSSAFSTLELARLSNLRAVFCSIDPDVMKSGETRAKALRVWSVLLFNAGVASRFSASWTPPPFDLSQAKWTFLTDPDGSGEKSGFQNGDFHGREPKPILIGKPWEEQGFNEVNPNVKTPADSQYDGFAWYFAKLAVPADLPEGKIFFHADGVKDLPTYNRTDNKTDLYINGAKTPPPSRVYNAFEGGNGARLWELDSKVLKKGEENFIAVRIFNSAGPAGLVRKPVRFEVPGRNEELLFPYEFQESKYTPYFFWSW